LNVGSRQWYEAKAMAPAWIPPLPPPVPGKAAPKLLKMLSLEIDATDTSLEKQGVLMEDRNNTDDSAASKRGIEQCAAEAARAACELGHRALVEALRVPTTGTTSPRGPFSGYARGVPWWIWACLGMGTARRGAALLT
jgi:hypothetical protein